MKELEKIQDLRFNLTEEMNNMFIEIIITHQMLEDSLKEDSKMSDEERFYKRVQEEQQERD